MKVCTVCKVEKHLDCFFNSKNTKDGKGYRCKECDKEVRKDSRSRSKATQEGYGRRKIAWTYGISVEDYDRMLSDQGGKCAICGTDNPLGEGNTTARRSFSFSVDHCHDTGKVRGLLCNTCNRGLGFFRDRVDLLQKATRYLESH